MENKLWYLKRSKLFERATEETVSHCEHFFTQKLFPKRTRIFDQGDPARMVYLVKSGKVKLVRQTEDAKEVLITVLGAGDLFGEEVVFEQVRRTTVAECIEPSLLCMARAEHVYAILSQHPVLALNVAKYLMEQRDDALSAVEDLAYLKVPERILKLLERLAAEHGKPAPDGGTLLDLRLTHGDIASLIGSTRETVSQQLGLLAKNGLIRTDGRAIVLL